MRGAHDRAAPAGRGFECPACGHRAYARVAGRREFSWKHCRRRSDQFADLLSELARWPHVRLADIKAVSERQPPHPTDRAAYKSAYNGNRALERKGLRALRRRLLGDLEALAGRKPQVLTLL